MKPLTIIAIMSIFILTACSSAPKDINLDGYTGNRCGIECIEGEE